MSELNAPLSPVTNRLVRLLDNHWVVKLFAVAGVAISVGTAALTAKSFDPERPGDLTSEAIKAANPVAQPALK